MSGLTFLSPLWLLLLIPVAALIAAVVYLERHRRKYAVRFSNVALLRSVVPRSPGWRRHVASGLLVVSLASEVVAMARPATMVKVPRQQATIMICIDVSLSMQSHDVKPSRIQAAQAGASSFVNELPSGYDVGLISFAGSANLLVPPTTQHAQVLQGIQQLQLQESTAIGEAIFTSLNAIKLVHGAGGKPPPAAIVLLTDGATNSGRSNQSAVDAARAAHVPVDTIAFGTPTGTVTINGQTSEVPVDRAALVQIAQETGGQEFDAPSAQRLKQIYQDLRQQLSFHWEAKEITAWFIALGLILGLLAAATSLYWQQRIP